MVTFLNHFQNLNQISRLYRWTVLVTDLSERSSPGLEEKYKKKEFSTRSLNSETYQAVEQLPIYAPLSTGS
jgi:hypothetical protein